MKEFYTAVELAGLPGLPGSVRRISSRGRREAWQSNKRAGRGGEREYHVNDLPVATRKYLIEKSKEAALPSIAANEKINNEIIKMASTRERETSLGEATCVTGAGRERMDAKIAILSALSVASAKTQKIAIERFVVDYKAGLIDLPSWVTAKIPSISYPTLLRWRAQLKKEGPGRLAGEFGWRKGKSIIDETPALKDFVVGCITEYPHTSCKQVYNGLKARFNESKIPCKRAVERWMARWKADNLEIFTAINNPDEWKNKFMTAFGSYSENITRLNELWEMDSSPADIMLIDGRHTLIAVLDVYPRRGKLLVSKTSKATALASLMRKTLLGWGVPEKLKIDNGQDYVSHHMTRIIHSIDIQKETCSPFSPWEKPHVERFFRTFAHGLAELQQGFIGHNVAERQAIEARRSFADRLMKKGETVEIKATATELQLFCDRWVESIYNHEPHTGLKGKTPFEMVDQWQAEPQRIKNERALDILLAEAPGDGWRAVTKKGVRLDNFTYIHEDMEPYVGQRVRVLYDPDDLGSVYIFGGADLDFICIAKCPEITDVSRKEVAIRTKKKQRIRVQKAKAELKATAKKVKVRDIAEEILAYHEQKNNVTLLDNFGTDYMSAGLMAAGHAVDAIDFEKMEREPAPVNDAAKAWVEEKMQEAEPGETPEERWEHWKELEGKAVAEISQADAEWKKVYESLSEFRGRKLVYDDLGDKASGY